MKQTRILMGMPITVEIIDQQADKKNLQQIFSYFGYVDNKFSTYKVDSEISQINRGEIKKKDWSLDMKRVFVLSEKTKRETDGYFDIIDSSGKYDPSGLVKGWSILNAANILKQECIKNFYIDAGGDTEVSGKNAR